MRLIAVSIFATLVVVAPLAPAQKSESSTVSSTPGTAKATQTNKATATVVAVDMATRTVTLKRPDGRIFDVHAGDEVKNLDKIKPGDKVSAEYTQALSLELKKGTVGAAKRIESSDVKRSPAGAPPSATMGSNVTILADVIAVNAKDKVVTLRGPQGHMVDLKVEDPAQLKNIKAGDQVEAVYTEALAIAVQPASGSKGK
jgi:Cu/Ag efflux protein CusF